MLDAVVDYTVEHGFSDLSWRPVAAALGTSTTTLVHRFGTKEQMLVAILGRLRERIFAATSDTTGEHADLATAARAAWDRTSDLVRGAEFRLFCAVYGRALQAPEQFAGFLDRVVAGWMNSLRDAQGPDTGPATATRRATLMIATIRELLLDLLATGDRDRVQDAAESFLAGRTRRSPSDGSSVGRSPRPWGTHLHKVPGGWGDHWSLPAPVGRTGPLRHQPHLWSVAPPCPWDGCWLCRRGRSTTSVAPCARGADTCRPAGLWGGAPTDRAYRGSAGV
ncbi:TetR/AcrR family transcriptional regulator [Actinoallomurus iriomotensis]|uniref:TetR/AcrR family transcriptional regulator n=1 Tax=Actinoallomurus iriomotensis TaxID=478107 RepID=UPI003D7FEC86